MHDTSAAAGGRDGLKVVLLPTSELTAATRAAVVALGTRAFAHDPAHDFTTLACPPGTRHRHHRHAAVRP